MGDRCVLAIRPENVAISAGATLEQLRQVVITEQYSRIPVYEQNIDQVIGNTNPVAGPFFGSASQFYRESGAHPSDGGGIGDVAGKYYVPKLGPFVIYTIMIVILIWRPNGLFGRTATR